MRTVYRMINKNGSELITVSPCDCGDCTGTTITIGKQQRRKRRKLELICDGETLDQLIELLSKARAYHAQKFEDDNSWTQCELN